VYGHEDVGVVLWVFDGVSEEPVPACRDEGVARPAKRRQR